MSQTKCPFCVTSCGNSHCAYSGASDSSKKEKPKKEDKPKQK